MLVDFHVHSYYSRDSLLSPKTIIKRARLKGLSAIAITDHNTMKGIKKTQSLAGGGIQVIPGCEILTERGELIGLFMNEEIQSRIYADTVDEIRDQGALILLPHPFKNRGEIPSDILHDIDLIEGLNARQSSGNNDRARNLGKERNIPMVAGSDAHISLEIGQSVTCFFDQEEIVPEIALRKPRDLLGEESSECMKSLSIASGRMSKILHRLWNEANL